MSKDLTDPGADLDEDRRAHASVLYDPAHGATKPLYSGSADNVRVWTDANGVEVTVGRFVKHRFSAHTHNSLMLGLIETGSKEFQRERQTHVAHPGSISLVNPGELHTGSRLDGAELRYRALYIPAELIVEAADCASAEIAFRSAVIQEREIYVALLRAHDAVVREDERLTRDTLILIALNMLVLRHGNRNGKRDSPECLAARREVIQARTLIEELYAEDLPIASIARSVGLSSFHLMRQFRRHVGIPIHAYQLQTRVERAKRLLAAGGRPSQVALDVGFTDQSHFTKRFKAIVGTSPASYQRDSLR